ncbi:hypothetical protein [Dyella silvatica]|uniref:hypothetical protein n=1 Tax=Dyella silvatica TaxID=2992128 RepID=UPI00224DFF7B|nr:hypothetical protein [Dyella silvatica]
MQRLYSMFPQGLPGCGLMLLRVAVILQWLTDVGPKPSAWLLAITVTLILTLALGALTSAASLLLLCHIALLGIDRGALSISAVGEALHAIALIFLGPGAYSLDARLFGRRTIELPRP